MAEDGDFANFSQGVAKHAEEMGALRRLPRGESRKLLPSSSSEEALPASFLRLSALSEVLRLRRPPEWNSTV